MATSKEQLRDDLPWDIDRIPVGVNEHASEGARNVLDDLEDEHLSVQRVAAYGRREAGEKRVATNDLLRALQHADGRLALVTWSSCGITSIGYQPDEQRFDVGQFSGIDKRMGNEPESYERASRSDAKELLSWSTPTVICRSESKLLPQLDAPEVTA